MVTMPSTLCSHPGCNARAGTDGTCQLHKPKAKPVIKQATPHKLKQIDRRPSAAKRGYDAKWRSARLLYLEDHPLCAHCSDKDVIKAADVVDHIIPHRGDTELFWLQANWQSLCYSCHSIKTTTVDNKLSSYDVARLKQGGAGQN